MNSQPTEMRNQIKRHFFCLFYIFVLKKKPYKNKLTELQQFSFLVKNLITPFDDRGLVSNLEMSSIHKPFIISVINRIILTFKYRI